MKCCRPTILTVLLPKQEERNSVDADWRVTSIIGMWNVRNGRINPVKSSPNEHDYREAQ
jgi:hypothetical protein